MIKKSTKISIPFYDVDRLKVVWFGNYFKYFDVARSLLLKKIKYDIIEMEKDGYTWPVIETNCKFKKYLKYKDKIEISASISEYKYKLKIDYLIKKNKKVVAQAYTIQIPISNKNNKILNMCPKNFIKAIEKFKK